MAYRLHLVFEDPDAFRAEFERNISMRGAFVPTGDPLELRSFVDVVISLPFCDESVVLEAEVVHIVAPERALNPGDVGVAVSFRKSASEIRTMFQGYLEEGAAELDAAAGTLDEAKTAADGGNPGGLLLETSGRYAPGTRFDVLLDGVDPPDLSNLEASVIDLADAGLEVARIVEIIPEESVDVYQTVRRLVERDVLKIRGAD